MVVEESAAGRGPGVFPGRAMGVLQLPPDISFIAERGSGPYLFDTEGIRYIDYVLGAGPMILGHAPESVVAAVSEAITRGSTFYSVNEPAIALAEELVSSVGCAERVRFMSGGSEATYLAVRLARAFTGRAKVLRFEGAFHGFHDISMYGVSPKEPFPKLPDSHPGSLGVSEAAASDVLVAPYNDAEASRRIAAAHDGEIAAILVEPIQREIAPAPGFLQDLRDLCRQIGALLIFDEMVTGFRLTYGGAQDLFGVIPDLATMGKIIGGGFPLSAVLGRADVLDLCDLTRKNGSVYLSGTLSGNPIAATAGLATLRELKKPGVYEVMEERGGLLREGMTRLLSEQSVLGTVVGEGPMFHVYFGTESVVNYRDAARSDRAASVRFAHELLRRGVFINPGKKAYMSLAHTPEIVERTLEAASDALAATVPASVGT